MMDTRTYNELEIQLGSMVLNYEKVLQNINSHFSIEEKPSHSNSNWFYRFNSEVIEMKNFIHILRYQFL